VSGANDATVVWVTPEGPGSPREDAAQALAHWARARGVTLAAASATTGARALKVDAALADSIEKELDRAREAVGALDGDLADRALARAEALVRDHPELPQGGWLRAEVHRGWAARWSRVEPRDAARAQAAWQEADALDGGRVPGVGETPAPRRRATPAVIRVSGAPSHRLVAHLDGVVVPGQLDESGALVFAVEVAPAEHHLRLSSGDETLFAAWVSIAETARGEETPFAVPVILGSAASACSGAAFVAVSRDAGGHVEASGVGCERWVAAWPATRRGAVMVARCERDACSPALEWRLEATSLDGAGAGSGAGTAVHRTWPAWATWTALGVGAAGAAVITIIATGALEARPVEQRFVAGGVRVE